MKMDWLWDRKLDESEVREVFEDPQNPRFISYAALLLSRKNFAKEVFKDFIKKQDFFISWNKIKKQMRKNSWTDPRIEYWQAIYDTLKKAPGFQGLKLKKIEEPVLPLGREIGEKIKEARQQSGLTQKKLAQKLRISQQIISRIESGRQNVSLTTLENVCKKLGIVLSAEKFGFKNLKKAEETSTKHILSFGSLSPDDFSRLCFWIVEKSQEFDRVEYYDGPGDKNRDIIGYKYAVGNQQKWYFQCKRHEKIFPHQLNAELDGVNKHVNEDEKFKPDVIVLVTACPVSPSCKDSVISHAKALAFERVDLWDDVKLDEKVKANPEIEDEFFYKVINNDDLNENFEKAEFVIFDFASLLNLSKMNLLGHLDKFAKQFFIAESLFQKVQTELSMSEQQNLRRLWQFISNSKDINLIEESRARQVAETKWSYRSGVQRNIVRKTQFLPDNNISKLEKENAGELFDQWIIDSIKAAKEKNAVFVTDDFQLLRFLKSKNIKGCNSLTMLKSMLSKEWIDNKVYSKCIGDLAERSYPFLPFSGEDLFQIVMEDHSEITPRTEYLINQMISPGSVPSSFTWVFVKFIDLLWKTGAIAEDKVGWLALLTNKIIEYLERRVDTQNDSDVEQIAPHFLQMWITAIHLSKKDEILLIQKKADEVLNKPYLTFIKQHVSRLIEAKKSSF